MRDVLKTAARAIKQYFRTADIFLLAVCLASAVFGLVLISSAGRVVYVGSGESKRLADISGQILTVQSLAIFIGVVLYVVISCVPLDLIARLWKWILGFNVIFILLLFTPLGEEINGNRSWLVIPGFPMNIQPAEVVKVTFILLLAKQISMLSERKRINNPISAGMLFAHLGLMVGAIFLPSRDIGMIVIYTLIFFTMCLASQLHPLWMALYGVLMAGGIVLIWPFIGERQQNRFIYGFSPELDPLDVGYQPLQGKVAIGGGGLTGQGLYQGLQNMNGAPPEKQTDFIFCVAAEELGFIGCIVILLLLSIIVIRCLYVSTRAKTRLASVACVGVAGMILFQTIINVGMNLALTPVIGLTLPFFSYGGSSIITTFAAVGMVSSAYKHPKTHLLSDKV